jgi:hypothetical protein
MEPENLKRKISQEIDSSADHDFSEDVKSGMESNVELKQFADDVVKIESMLENVNEQTGRDFDPKPLMEKISKAVKDAKPGDDIPAEFLSEPMPETEEDKVSDAPREQPAFTFPIISASADAEPEKPPRRDEDFGRLTSRRMRAGAAEGESSGLINIGALVQEHRESQVPKAPPETAAASTAAAAARQPRPPAGRKFIYIALIALFAVVGIVAIVQIGLMSKHKGGTEQASSALDEKAMEEELKAQIMASMEKQKAGVAPTEAQQPQEPALSTEEEGEAAEEQATGGEEHLAKKKKKGGLAAPSSGGAEESGEKEAPATEPTPKEKGQSDLLSLLDSATQKKEKTAGTENKAGTKSTVPDVEDLMGEKKPAAKQEEGGASDLPATLSKNQIRAVMQKLNPQIRKCGEGKVGNLILNLIVNSDGSVKSVKITGDFANDPVGKCAEGVAKTAKFPPFKNPTMTVTYPYVFTPPPGV